MNEDPSIPQESPSPDEPKAAPDSAPQTPEAAHTEAPKSAPRQPIPVAVEASGTQQTLDKLLKGANQLWVKVQPILKKQGTQALLAANRFTEHFLDDLWPKLSDQAVTALPNSFKAQVQEQRAKLQPTLTKLKPLWDKGIVPAWQKGVVPFWTKGLVLLRQRLPQDLAPLTNRFLTLAVLTLFLGVYWIFSSLTAPPAAAKRPPTPTKPVLTRPAPSPIAQRPRVAPSSPVPTAPPLRPRVSPSPIASATPKPDLPSPTVVKAPPVVSKPAPDSAKPSLDLADLQAQLTSTIADAGDALITTVKAPLGRQTLSVTVSRDWEALPTARQTAAAQKLWQKAQALDFDRLELRDLDNQLLARSPVVGQNIIVLKSAPPRQTAPQTTP